MATIAQKLDQGRQSLLDLSTRNRLLSIPKRTSSKLINVYDEKSEEAYRILVTDNKSMTFVAGKKGANENLEEDPSDDEAGVYTLVYKQPYVAKVKQFTNLMRDCGLYRPWSDSHERQRSDLTLI